MEQNNLITCKNVSFDYEGNYVLNNLNFVIEKNDYLCIVGKNGAGKSTLIKGLLNIKQPSNGKIVMENGLLPNEIGYLPQQTDTQKDFPASVYEVVLSGCLNRLGMKPFYTKKEKNIVQENLDRMGISNLKNHCYRELSGGQQQRVLLARALCATKKMILLDEPVAGLDPVVTKELYSLIKKINEDLGITIVMVSHDIKMVVEDSKHILHISDSNIFYGTTNEYINSDLGKCFIGGETNA